MKNTIVKAMVLAAIFLLAGFCRESLAQALPGAAKPGAVERGLQPRPVAEPARLPEILIQDEKVSRLADAKARFQLREILFEGNLIFTRDHLRSLAAPFVGRTVEVAQLAEIADLVTRHYQDAGYFLSRAYIPPQAIRDGRVTIKIREGRLGEVIVNGNRRYSRELIRNALRIVRDRGAVRLGDVERALLLLMDYPGLRIRATFKPGALPATTDLVLDVTEDPLLSFGVDYNNFGSRFVARDRLGLSLGLSNPFGIGDQFSVRGTTGLVDPEELFFGRLEYTLPLGYSGVRLGVNWSAMQYELGGPLAHLNAGGDSFGGGVWLSYPIVRSRNLNWFVSTGFEGRNVAQEIQRLEVGRDRTRHVYAGTTLQWIDSLHGSNSVSVRGYQGFSRVLGGMERFDADTIRLGTDAAYFKAELEASRIQRLPWRTALLLQLESQWTGDRMPSSEQFQLGGAGSVRGYAQSERSGDRGFFASAELRLPIPGLGDARWGKNRRAVNETLQMAVFYDYGKSWISDARLWGEESLHGNVLQGAGVGLRFTYSPRVRFKLDWATSVGGVSPARERDADSGVWYLQGAISF